MHPFVGHPGSWEGGEFELHCIHKRHILWTKDFCMIERDTMRGYGQERLQGAVADGEGQYPPCLTAPWLLGVYPQPRQLLRRGHLKGTLPQVRPSLKRRYPQPCRPLGWRHPQLTTPSQDLSLEGVHPRACLFPVPRYFRYRIYPTLPTASGIHNVPQY